MYVLVHVLFLFWMSINTSMNNNKIQMQIMNVKREDVKYFNKLDLNI